MVHDGLDVDASTAAHGRAGVVRLARARHLARGAGRAGRCARTSARSQAIDEGRFEDEIVPVGERRRSTRAPRRDTSLEKLATLKPVFDPEGTTTAGNAPGVNDGAGALVVTSEEFAKRARPRGAGDDRRPRATSRTTSPTSRGRRRRPGRSRSRRPGKTIDDVERVEMNEAFSSVALNSAQDARRRRGEGERERRRRRARPPDRRLGRADRRRRWSTSCAATAAGSGSRRSAPAAARATRS